MINAKRPKEDRIVLFEWDEELSFDIRYLCRTIANRLRRNATMKIAGRMRDKTEDMNPIYFSELFIKKAITGWKGLTYKKLREICEPLVIEEEDLNKKIEFSDENLEFISKNANVEFSNFVIKGADFIGEEVEEELKNFESTSGGKKTV
jgi:hypothetical protein